KIDGDFGPRTESALKAFQKSRGIEADGIFGAQSRAAFSRDQASSSEGTPSRPNADNTPSAPANGNGSITYNGKRVSDPVLRNKLEQVADFFGRNITVTSGDRDFVPKGGSRTSLHLAHRAVDLHVQGVSDAEVFSKLKSSGILNSGYEVIRHGPNTATGGPHVHIGHYGDGRPSQFKLEGVPGRAASGQYVKV
ncbi:MAG: Penicillin-resistant DD-carboxypeptidase, partial [bacterium]